MIKIYSILLFVLLFFVSSCTSQSKTKSITEISQKEINKGILLDVRTPEEFLAGHLENAVNINWFSQDFNKAVVDKIPKNKTLYVYCQAGVRSGKATLRLLELGYTDIVDLSDGYAAYKK